MYQGAPESDTSGNLPAAVAGQECVKGLRSRLFTDLLHIMFYDKVYRRISAS